MALFPTFHFNHSLPLANGSIRDVITLVQGFSDAEELMSQVVILVCLLLVMCATNAISEHSFSAMTCIKTYM